MKKNTSVIKKMIALLLVTLTLISSMAVGLFSASASTSLNTKYLFSVLDENTFSKLLEKGISSGAKAGATAALSPLISIIGQELLGLPSETGLPEIMSRLDEIDDKLDRIQAELSEGFKKVLEEMTKNEKMGNTINALAEAEFLADLILDFENTGNLPQSISEIAELTGEEQKRIIEINAELIKYETVEKLYNQLSKAKAYLTNGGYIDSNYETAYKVYYDYMKSQSMFCGEAAMKAELFWELMKESYSRSCIALIYALEQQLAMYELSKCEPGNGITQEAIDAASVASSFGAKSVIEKKLSKIKSEGEEVLKCYCTFILNAQAESTVYINKGTCYIKLSPDLSFINFDGCNDYETYVAGEGFYNGGITKELYDRTIKSVNEYFYNRGDNYMDASTVSYEEFISNNGPCSRYDSYRDSLGFTFIEKKVYWNSHSKYAFKNILMNMKVEKYNSSNKPDDNIVNEIINYICCNYNTMSIADYLVKVGFSFGEFDITKEGSIFMPDSSLSMGNGSRKIKCNGKMYDVAILEKNDAGSFDNCIGNADPSGTIFYFENAEDTIDVTIESDAMDGRIHKGVYTIEGKEIVGYNQNGTPVYTPYKKVIEVEGTENVNLRLPVSLDYSTVTITLGYEGLGASSNHENVCSFKMSELSEKPENITLKMEGYTKIWLGYGVNAEILCDGISMVKGKG